MANKIVETKIGRNTYLIEIFRHGQGIDDRKTLDH